MAGKHICYASAYYINDLFLSLRLFTGLPRPFTHRFILVRARSPHIPAPISYVAIGRNSHRSGFQGISDPLTIGGTTMTDWTDPSNYDPDDLPPWERAAMRRASLAGLITPRRIFWAVAIVGLVIYLAANWQYASWLRASRGIRYHAGPDRNRAGPSHNRAGPSHNRRRHGPVHGHSRDGRQPHAGRLQPRDDWKNPSAQPIRRRGCICFCRNTPAKSHTCSAMSVGASSQRWATL